MKQNYFSDTIVCIIIVLSTIAFFYALTEKSRTKKLVEQMSKDMEALQQAEEQLKKMQEQSQEQMGGEMLNDEREQKLLGEIESAKVKNCSFLFLKIFISVFILANEFIISLSPSFDILSCSWC